MGQEPQHLRQEPGPARPRTAGPDELSEQDPETLRRDISTTREDMGHTLDEIEDRIRPSRIVERRTQRVRGTFRRAKDAVMGAGDEARQAMRGGVRERAGQAVGTVEHAPDAAMERTRGNPLAAGLVAFGAGAVAAGMLPDTRSEQRVAGMVEEQLQPVTEHVGEAAREVGHDVADSARESAQRTAEHAREEAQGVAQDVRQEGQGS